MHYRVPPEWSRMPGAQIVSWPNNNETLILPRAVSSFVIKEFRIYLTRIKGEFSRVY